MIYFDDRIFQFYRELDNNNHKEWFHANKERYQKEVYSPFVCFVDDLIQNLKSHGLFSSIAAEQAIFRPNRDLRFGKDKRPYKAFSSALISFGNSKTKELPSLYIELGEQYFKISAGIFKATGSNLSNLRKVESQLIKKIETSEVDWHIDLKGRQGSITSSVTIDIKQLIFEGLFMEITMNFWSRTFGVNHFLWSQLNPLKVNV